MVMYVFKSNIHPGKLEAYMKWTEGAIKRTTFVPGVIEFRAYRPASGLSQVVLSEEFANMEDWASWHSSEEMQKGTNELHTLALDVTNELWGMSPVVPAPTRPKKYHRD